MHSSKRTNKKKNSCIFMHQTYIFQQGQNQEQRPSRLSTRSEWRTTTLTSQYKVKMKKKKLPSRLSTRSLQSKIYNPLVSVQGQSEKKRPSRLSTRSKWKKTTLSSQYKVKMKIYDPLVSVQGHFNPKFMTLSSQYKVTSIKNLRSSRLSTRSKWKKKKRPFRLSTRSLQSKIYDPLVSVQGHFNPKFTTLSSQYKVRMKKKTTLSSQYKVSSNPKFTTLLSQYKISLRYATLSSQYKVSASIYTFILLSFIFITERN